VERDAIRTMMNEILAKQGRDAPGNEAASLRDVGFRSLDFSELALRVEMAVGDELTFDAAALRGIETVADVLDFFETTTRAA
jgi:acyl carrier protein